MCSEEFIELIFFNSGVWIFPVGGVASEKVCDFDLRSKLVFT